MVQIIFKEEFLTLLRRAWGLPIPHCMRFLLEVPKALVHLQLVSMLASAFQCGSIDKAFLALSIHWRSILVFGKHPDLDKTWRREPLWHSSPISPCTHRKSLRQTVPHKNWQNRMGRRHVFSISIRACFSVPVEALSLMKHAGVECYCDHRMFSGLDCDQ